MSESTRSMSQTARPMSQMAFDVPIDNVRPKPRAGKSDRDPVELDVNRLFYVSEGAELGGLRHTWRRYRVNVRTRSVTIIWDDNDTLLLQGEDAHDFLKIVRDKHARMMFDE